MCREAGALQVVHKYIGQEPSGRNFNEICLDKSGIVFTTPSAPCPCRQASQPDAERWRHHVLRPHPAGDPLSLLTPYSSTDDRAALQSRREVRLHAQLPAGLPSSSHCLEVLLLTIHLQRIAGGEAIGFNNAVFLSEVASTGVVLYVGILSARDGRQKLLHGILHEGIQEAAL